MTAKHLTRRRNFVILSPLFTRLTPRTDKLRGFSSGNE